MIKGKEQSGMLQIFQLCWQTFKEIGKFFSFLLMSQHAPLLDQLLFSVISSVYRQHSSIPSTERNTLKSLWAPGAQRNARLSPKIWGHVVKVVLQENKCVWWKLGFQLCWHSSNIWMDGAVQVRIIICLLANQFERVNLGISRRLVTPGM